MRLRKLTIGLMMALLVTTSGYAVEKQANAREAAMPDECTEELLVDVFPDHMVKKVLLANGINQAKIDRINKALDEGIAVRDESEENQESESEDLTEEELLKLFTSVLHAEGIKDDARIKKMHLQIQDMRLEAIKRCIGASPK